MIKKSLILAAGLTIAASSFAGKALTVWIIGNKTVPVVQAQYQSGNATNVQRLSMPNGKGLALNPHSATTQNIHARLSYRKGSSSVTPTSVSTTCSLSLRQPNDQTKPTFETSGNHCKIVVNTYSKSSNTDYFYTY